MRARTSFSSRWDTRRANFSDIWCTRQLSLLIGPHRSQLQQSLLPSTSTKATLLDTNLLLPSIFQRPTEARTPRHIGVALILKVSLIRCSIVKSRQAHPKPWIQQFLHQAISQLLDKMSRQRWLRALRPWTRPGLDRRPTTRKSLKLGTSCLCSRTWSPLSSELTPPSCGRKSVKSTCELERITIIDSNSWRHCGVYGSITIFRRERDWR